LSFFRSLISSLYNCNFLLSKQILNPQHVDSVLQRSIQNLTFVNSASKFHKLSTTIG
jgi:hypothetical protein